MDRCEGVRSAVGAVCARDVEEMLAGLVRPDPLEDIDASRRAAI